MDVWTTFTREDYTRVLVEQFGLERAHGGERSTSTCAG